MRSDLFLYFRGMCVENPWQKCAMRITAPCEPSKGSAAGPRIYGKVLKSEREAVFSQFEDN